MKILVVGQSGQVARALAELGEASPHEITCLGRPDLDLTRPGSIDTAMARVSPDIVINASAYTAVDAAESDQAAAFALNRDAVGDLARITARASVPLLHISTDYVFDGTKSGAYTEDDPVAPTGVYGSSKLEGERAAAENPAHFILRTAWVYSPFGKNFVKTMLRLASDRDAVGVVADQIGNPTSAADIAAGLLAVAEQAQDAPFGVYHLAGTGEGSWADLAECIFAASAAAGGPLAEVNRIATTDYPTPARRPANSRLDCGKFKSVFKINPPAWQDSVRDVTTRLVIEGMGSQ
jgi:dTDP-4-dehydrorhamnose reductase